MSRKTQLTSAQSQAGFTLVEFLIASVVFATVLLGVTAAVLYMQNTYRRSLYTSNTQQVTGTVVDAVAQAIKFSNSDITQITGTTSSLCIGNRQFLFVPHRQVSPTGSGATITRHGLVSRPNNGCATTDIVSSALAADMQDLLSTDMRLVRFTVAQEGGEGLYRVTVRVGYGDDTAFCSPAIAQASAGGCGKGAPLMTAADLTTREDLMCRPDSLRYCAVSELSTTVLRRL